MRHTEFDPTEWAGRKYRCMDTGEELTIPHDVRPKQFFAFGECFVDVGDGYYGRMGGNLEEICAEGEE